MGSPKFCLICRSFWHQFQLIQSLIMRWCFSRHRLYIKWMCILGHSGNFVHPLTNGGILSLLGSIKGFCNIVLRAALSKAPEISKTKNTTNANALEESLNGVYNLMQLIGLFGIAVQIMLPGSLEIVSDFRILRTTFCKGDFKKNRKNIWQII